MRLKNTGNYPPPRPPVPRSGGHWLAGMMIGTTIMTMATHAMVLGTGAALKDCMSKQR